MMLSDLTTDDLIAMVNGPKNKMLIDEMYEAVFRPHFKYEEPLFPGKKLTSKEIIILEIIWKKLENHFYADE
jgi:hypothetical protein